MSKRVLAHTRSGLHGIRGECPDDSQPRVCTATPYSYEYFVGGATSSRCSVPNRAAKLALFQDVNWLVNDVSQGTGVYSCVPISQARLGEVAHHVLRSTSTDTGQLSSVLCTDIPAEHIYVQQDEAKYGKSATKSICDVQAFSCQAVTWKLKHCCSRVRGTQWQTVVSVSTPFLDKTATHVLTVCLDPSPSPWREPRRPSMTSRRLPCTHLTHRGTPRVPFGCRRASEPLLANAGTRNTRVAGLPKCWRRTIVDLPARAKSPPTTL